MTSTVRTVSRKVVNRSWRDLDPKVAILATIVIVCDLVLAYLWITGRITTPTFTAGIGPSGVGTLAAYLRTSSHSALVDEAAKAVAELPAIAPAAEELLPEAAPVIQGGVEVLEALTAPDPIAAVTPEAPATSPTTETLALSAPRPATAGGQ